MHVQSYNIIRQTDKIPLIILSVEFKAHIFKHYIAD